MEAADFDALATYLPQHVPGFAGLEAATRYKGGQSNPTYLLKAQTGRYVLRRRPPGKLLPSAHAVDREFRVMQALAGSDVPVAPALHLCLDDSVIGAAFYVMGFVDGHVYWDPALPDVSAGARAPIYGALIDTLARLHRVDPAAVGLGDYGKPEAYAARQIGRWSRQYHASRTGEDPDMDRLIAWLAENVPPEDGRASLVHGDYRLDNLMFAHDRPEVLAVLDWELSTIGHPFADLAYVLMHHRLPHDGVFKGLAGLDRGALGLPTEAELVAAYCGYMGLERVNGLDFWLALGFFRLAAILDGVKRRIIDGNASDPERGRTLVQAIPVLVAQALEIADRGL